MRRHPWRDYMFPLGDIGDFYPLKGIKNVFKLDIKLYDDIIDHFLALQKAKDGQK